MEQDLREMFKKEQEKERHKLKNGHKERFLNRLEDALPQSKKSNYNWLKIAASILVFVSIALGYRYFIEESPSQSTIVDREVIDVEEETDLSFGDLSPDLKKVENYYVTNINMELAKLRFSPDTKDLVNSFMEQLNNLNLEYKSLNQELNDLGPNDQTITALIENLQLRLQLLQKLKKKLNELKTSKNEQIQKNSI